MTHQRMGWAVGLLLLVACADRSPPPRRPLILVGIDGLEWSLLLRFSQQGLLPEFGDLLQRGCYGPLETLVPTHSPAIWTTVATGKLPNKHGIPTFAYEEDGEDRLYTSGHRKTKALWNILSDAGRRVHAIGWWNSFPVEPIDGVMIAQTSSRNQVRTTEGQIWKGRFYRDEPGQVHPPERQEEFFAIAREAEDQLDARIEATFGSFTRPLSPLGKLLWKNSRWALLADQTYAAIARELIENEPDFDLMMLYLGSVDVLSHRFWRYLDPDAYEYPPTEDEVANFHFLIQAAYCWVDDLLGELRALAPEADFLVLSDHGFYGTNVELDFDAEAELGALISGDHATGPPAFFLAVGDVFRVTGDWKSSLERGDPSRLKSLGAVQDVAPTVLALKGIPYGEDMDGRPLRSVLHDAFLERHPSASIASHDDPAWLGRRAERRDAAIDSQGKFNAEMLRQLDELGYLDRDGNGDQDER